MGVVLLVEKVVRDDELDELEVELDVELDVVDEEDVLLELDVVEVLSVLEEVKVDDVVGVEVVVGVVVDEVVDGVGVVDVLLWEVVEVLDLEVVVELFVLDVKVLNLGSPLDKLNVMTTVLVASSRHQLHVQEIPFQKQWAQGILTRRRPLPTNKPQNPEHKYQKPSKHPHLNRSTQVKMAVKKTSNLSSQETSHTKLASELGRTNPVLHQKFKIVI